MNTIRWGILGTGTIAKQFAQGLQLLPDAQLLAIGSRSNYTADEFAKQFSVPRSYASYEELASDDDIDVVYIATPHIKHKENCILCLNAGKAVLCEKPFTINAEEAQEVIDLARQKQLFCMEAMWMRFMPLMVRLQDVIRQKEIGDICMINASMGMRVAFDPNHRAFNPELAGGALLDLGVYPLSFTFQLLGAPSSIVSQPKMSSTGVDEQAAIILDYEAGPLASITTSLRTDNPNDAFIMGTEGQIHVHGPLYRPQAFSITKYPVPLTVPNATSGIVSQLKQIEFLRKVYRRLRDYSATLTGKSGRTISAPTSGNGYHYEAAEVMRCLRAGERESRVMPLDETLQIMATMDTIRGQWNLKFPQEIKLGRNSRQEAA